nr:TonB-dependent receptor [Pseudomonadales bacterium]
MKISRKSICILTAGSFFGSGMPASAVGQELVTAIEEITVTAQRREESLQETPIAITAFGKRQLETQRISNVMDLLNKVPSVNLAPWAGSRVAPNLFIRGMGNLNTQSTNDMATGIYIDGVPVGRGVGLATDFADLERVEVLRGPQGTLWGRNTTAGAISFITQKPDDELGGSVQLSAGSWDERMGRATVNVPLNDKLYARVGYMRVENDGWVDNHSALPNQINFNEDREKEAVKAAVRYQPSENLTVDYGFDNSSMEYGNHFYQVIVGPRAVSGRQRNADPSKGQTPSDTEVSGHNLSLSWTLGDLTLKSITAYRDLDSEINMNFIDVFTQDRTMEQDQLSQELQLIGETGDGRVNYVSGLFYIEEEADETLASLFAGGRLVDAWVVDAEAESAAAYGQVSWTPPVLRDRLELTFGLRYTDDTREATKTFVNPGFTPAVKGLVIPGELDFDSLDPMVNVAYAFSDNINAYARFSTGYRAGGFNAQSTPAYFAPGYEQEEVEAYEVGLKSEFLDNRVRLNVALFDNEYTDLQVDQARTPPVFVDTLNAGEATIKGLEIEAVAVLATGLTFNVFYSQLDAEYDSYIDGGVELASVRHVPNSPDWQIGAGLEYEFLRTDFGNFTLNVDYRAQDEFYAGPIENTLSPDYDIWNARLELADIPLPYGEMRVAVWGKNLDDEEYRLSTTNLSPLSAQFGAPRSTGIDLIYEF